MSSGLDSYMYRKTTNFYLQVFEMKGMSKQNLTPNPDPHTDQTENNWITALGNPPPFAHTDCKTGFGVRFDANLLFVV